MTIGQKEDDRAFEVWAEGFFLAKTGYMGQYGPAIDRYPHVAAELRAAFDAGMKRGEEKRGCCEKRDG